MKKEDWHRLNPSCQESSIELDLANWKVRARCNDRSPWVYKDSIKNVLHGLTTGERIVLDQNKV